MDTDGRGPGDWSGGPTGQRISVSIRVHPWFSALPSVVLTQLLSLCGRKPTRLPELRAHKRDGTLCRRRWARGRLEPRMDTHEHGWFWGWGTGTADQRAEPYQCPSVFIRGSQPFRPWFLPNSCPSVGGSWPSFANSAPMGAMAVSVVVHRAGGSPWRAISVFAIGIQFP